MKRPLLLLLALLALLLAACGEDEDPPEPSEEQAAESQSESGGGDAGGCKDVAAPKPKPDGGAKKPAKPLASGKTYRVVMTTSCGEFTIGLDQKISPNTAASFASLARSGFYDNTVFHRIVPEFVIQGGDPTGTGTGGPGYSTRDTPPGDTSTPRLMAMARPNRAAGTSVASFYGHRPRRGIAADYAVLAGVKGQDVVEAIGQQGDPASGGTGTPLQPVVLESATLVTKG